MNTIQFQLNTILNNIIIIFYNINLAVKYAYAAYAAGHVREFIYRYKPSSLWKDLGWSKTGCDLTGRVRIRPLRVILGVAVILLIINRTTRNHPIELEAESAPEAGSLKRLNFNLEQFPKYAATAESLRTHSVPEWWRDAKLGIFIHWGVYSVPGYAPVNATPPELLRDHNQDQLEKMKGMPYAEWLVKS